MAYELDEIKSDLISLNKREFYIKHILKSDNWYLEKYMEKDSNEVLKMLDEYKLIVSECFKVSFNSVIMVGSAKHGFSLTPPNANKNMNSKFLKPFHENSDIDVAIISSRIFHMFWKLFRDNFSFRNKNVYDNISLSIYRGYINEKNITKVTKCNIVWKKFSAPAKEQLALKLLFKNEISFRIYRDWDDFEEYHMHGIEKIKKMEI